MVVKTPIFDREDRSDHMRRDAIERHVRAFLTEEREDRPIAPIENDGGLWRGIERDAAGERRGSSVIGYVAIAAPANMRPPMQTS